MSVESGRKRCAVFSPSRRSFSPFPSELLEWREGSELDTPTKDRPCRSNDGGRDSFSVRNASQRSKDHLRQTEQPNALPASWRCPGQPGALWEDFSLATPGSFSVMDATAPAMS